MEYIRKKNMNTTIKDETIDALKKTIERKESALAVTKKYLTSCRKQVVNLELKLKNADDRIIGLTKERNDQLSDLHRELLFCQGKLKQEQITINAHIRNQDILLSQHKQYIKSLYAENVKLKAQVCITEDVSERERTIQRQKEYIKLLHKENVRLNGKLCEINGCDSVLGDESFDFLCATIQGAHVLRNNSVSEEPFVIKYPGFKPSVSLPETTVSSDEFVFENSCEIYDSASKYSNKRHVAGTTPDPENTRAAHTSGSADKSRSFQRSLSRSLDSLFEQKQADSAMRSDRALLKNIRSNSFSRYSSLPTNVRSAVSSDLTSDSGIATKLFGPDQCNSDYLNDPAHKFKSKDPGHTPNRTFPSLLKVKNIPDILSGVGMEPLDDEKDVDQKSFHIDSFFPSEIENEFQEALNALKRGPNDSLECFDSDLLMLNLNQREDSRSSHSSTEEYRSTGKGISPDVSPIGTNAVSDKEKDKYGKFRIDNVLQIDKIQEIGKSVHRLFSKPRDIKRRNQNKPRIPDMERVNNTIEGKSTETNKGKVKRVMTFSF